MKNRTTKSEKLEKNRGVFFQIGLICSLSLCLWAFEYKTPVKTLDVFSDSPDNKYEVDEIPVTFQKPIEMPLPKQINTQLKIVDNNIKIDKETSFQTELIKTPDPVLFQNVVYKEDKKDELEIVLIAEKMAEFPGGESSMFEFMGKNIKYPQMALKEGIRGTVYISFVVEPDGSLSNKEVLRSIGGGCDEEAMRIINIMPKWIPAQQGGKNVRIKVSIPISFKIIGLSK